MREDKFQGGESGEGNLLSIAVKFRKGGDLNEVWPLGDEFSVFGGLGRGSRA